MSLRLLLDEDSQAKKLVNLLRQAGHDILTVNQTGLMGKPDSMVLDRARQEDRILLTRLEIAMIFATFMQLIPLIQGF